MHHENREDFVHWKWKERRIFKNLNLKRGNKQSLDTISDSVYKLIEKIKMFRFITSTDSYCILTVKLIDKDVTLHLPTGMEH